MKNLALFDLDQTLIPADSDHEWGHFMVRSGLVDPITFKKDVERFYNDYKNGCLDIHAYLDVVLTPLTQHSRKKLAALHLQFMQEVIEPILLPSAKALIAKHQKQGDLCCIITATNTFVTGPIARAFGIDHLIGIEPATLNNDPDAIFTGKIKGVPSFREGKITRADSWLETLGKSWSNFEHSYFYSDSHNDIPLLEKVTRPIATNPDTILRAHAIKKGWTILELFEDLDLRKNGEACA